MLSVSKLGMNKINYYLNQLVEYYAGRGENPYATWLGAGAGRAALTGVQVVAEVFKSLLKGFDPTGEKKWVQNAGKFIGSERDRMPGYDLTFSAPKSVSYLWSIAAPELRAQIERDFQEAVAETMAKIEAKAFIRTGKSGKDQIACGLVAMSVTHHTARQRDSQTRPDPQLHSHVLVINTGITRDGKTGALNGLRFLNKQTGRGDKQFALEFGQEFRQAFAAKLEARGFGIRLTDRTKFLWEISGVSEPEIRRNSKRSKQIRAVAPDGTHSPRQRRAATIRTRQAKREFEPSELFAVWQREAAQRGITAEVVRDLRRMPENEQRSLPRDRGRGGIER
ncbi:MAG TPA: MobF family relaxase [Blastocatellia bacterium]|nr:MobF family relaxase [Blastocatellia bacterium]